jgi:hypothetical protein
MESLRQRMENLRARASPATARVAPPRTVDVSTDKFEQEFRHASSPRDRLRAQYAPSSARVDAMDNADAHASVDAALEHLEALAKTTPAIRSALELVRRGPDGRVTVDSFARVAEALREISIAIGASPEGTTTRRERGLGGAAAAPGVAGAAPTSSPRVVSPSGLRRSASPIGPPRRVLVDDDGMEGPGTASAPPMTMENEGEGDADESAHRLREWSEHVRSSQRAAEASQISHQIREDMIEQYRSFLTTGAAPSDPFVAALAEQLLGSIREKEEMTNGVHRARRMIEALSKSDKAKSLAIERLTDVIQRMGGQVPEDITNAGIAWSREAFDEDDTEVFAEAKL